MRPFLLLLLLCLLAGVLAGCGQKGPLVPRPAAAVAAPAPAPASLPAASASTHVPPVGSH